MKYLLIIYWIWINCIISILYEKFHSCDFTKNILMMFFIQMNIKCMIFLKIIEKLFSFEI